MKIVEININDIHPYENNPRINDDAVDAVAASIQEFGWKQPIVVDVNNVIVAGHTRYKAAQKLGLTKIPCVVASDLSEEQIRAYRLADNKTAELADWNFGMLDEELDEILDINMEQFGFDDLFMVPEEEYEDSPKSFDAVDDNKETRYKCPVCGYEWN